MPLTNYKHRTQKFVDNILCLYVTAELHYFMFICN